MLLMRTMREVQPCHIHTGIHEVPQYFFGITDGADCANDLGSAHLHVSC